MKRALMLPFLWRCLFSDFLTQTALYHGQPISPVPLHTSETAEVLLPLTDSASALKKERFKKSFRPLSIKLYIYSSSCDR